MLNSKPWFQWVLGVIAGIVVAGWLPSTVLGQKTTPKPDFPPHAQILKGYEKVVSTADGQKSLYTIWTRKKDGQMLAEVPRTFATDRYFIALTVASGERFAGLQAGDLYVYWRRFDKRLALIEPNVSTRSNGDPESKASVKRLFTDRVLLDVPILTLGPGGGPVIDMRGLLIGHASSFFGSSFRPQSSNLATIKKAKAFPDNVELAFEFPTSRGRLQTLHYSISIIRGNSKYKPRKADERIGFFTTSYSDLGKYKDDETRVRFINRWHLEKRKPSLKLSPPVKPIVFYTEHTTPVQYRRWVRQGILYWNQAFEKVGIVNAIEVDHQDAATGRHMDKDPEDVRWNFIRWLNNDIGTAIGPSRVNPMTGQILDADIILTDGWIRHYWHQFDEIMPEIAMEGFSPETLAWLVNNPSWDPRIRLAAPSQRDYLTQELQRKSALPYGGYLMSRADSKLIGDDPFDGLIGRTSQVNGMCLASKGKQFDVTVMRTTLALLEADAKESDKKDKKDEKNKKDKDDEKKEDEAKIDGMPEWFVGPLMAELVAHEVGHTLGLRHNFKASSIYTLTEINSDKIKGKKPLAGSVMDYLPVNINMKTGKLQGDFTMTGIGPYDFWAIEYGYTLASDLKPILARVAEPELAYATDEDTSGPDPLARRYDLSKNPNDYAQNQIRLAMYHRARIIDKFVKDGDSWSKARRGYELTLSLQLRSVSMMANWLGGAYVYRDRKGDKNGRIPIEVVPVKTQRDALKFVIENTFLDKAYGLTPDLLSRMTVDKWLDGFGFHRAFTEEPTWPIHDRIMGIQASTLTMLMNPTVLRRVYDNEFRVEAKQDMITIPELLDTISSAIWSELDKMPDKQYTARSPMISSLRRNLQQEHLQRLIKLSMPGSGSTEAYKAVANLTWLELRKIRSSINNILQKGGKKIDPYSTAHLIKTQEQITKALNAQHIYNVNDFPRPSSRSSFRFGNDGESQGPRK